MGSSISKKRRAKAGQNAGSGSSGLDEHHAFLRVSSSEVKDGLIHKEELQLALFQNHKKRNLFLDKIFDIFYVDDNGRICRICSNIERFPPKNSDSVKTTYAFKLYDLRRTGYIEHEELKEMVLALLDESDLVLSDDIVEMIVDKDADGKADGKIDEEEWKEYVAQNPSLLKNMTLPYLMDITLAFPSFVLNNKAERSKP
ncbi:calcineurin B-like protein 7 [Pyrus communis]|uniref:calcineurin B-like protein 7 n=1 Tax=Pyrus communis TaxID=23211 RepID=UPI0035BF5072